MCEFLNVFLNIYECEHVFLNVCDCSTLGRTTVFLSSNKTKNLCKVTKNRQKYCSVEFFLNVNFILRNVF